MSALQPDFAAKGPQAAPYDAAKFNNQDVDSLREVAINHAQLLDTLASSATPVDGPLLIAAGTAYKAWGDSVTEAPDFPTNSYAARLGAALGGTFTNYGVSGSTIYAGISSLYTNSELAPARAYVASLGFGINDWRSYQDNSGNAYFLRAVRLFLEHCFAKQRLLADNVAITYSAGWEASAFPNGAQILSPGAAIKHASGAATASVAVTDSDHCTLGLWSSTDNFQSDAVNVYVDNVRYTTVNPKLLIGSSQNGTAAIFVRFPRGNHVVKLENANSGLNIFLDYALVRRPATEASAPVLVYAALDISGEGNLRNGLSQGQWDALNQRTRAVVEQFQRQRYPVRWVNLNTGYDYTPPATSDGVHPTAATHGGVLLPNVLAELVIA
jgi:hypothetical protein